MWVVSYVLISLSQIWIYGNSFESFLVAVVNPKTQAIEHWAKENGVSGDINSLCENPTVKDYILEQLLKLGKEKRVYSVYSVTSLQVSITGIIVLSLCYNSLMVASIKCKDIGQSIYLNMNKPYKITIYSHHSSYSCRWKDLN